MYQHSESSKPHLSPRHQEMLFKESAIGAAEIAESGARTIRHGRELPRGFSKRQRERGAGILFRVPRPNGETTWVFRPDEADPDNPGLKYEAMCRKLGGPGNVLYVHPSQRHLIADRSVPVIFVEGIKKALAIITAARAAGVEILVIGILGVWNWMAEGKPIADMLGISVDGRDAYICFDSDVFCNPDVADAARRLVSHLKDRGAAVIKIAYLPDQADGSKTGADDFLAGGHTYAELAATFKPFNADDLAAERLKRGGILRAKLEHLRRTFWATEFKGMGGHSSRDVLKVLIDLAAERGKLHEDGLRVKISRRELARLAKVSNRTLTKAIGRLEDMRLLYRDIKGRKAEAAGAFVLRAGVAQYGEGPTANGNRATPLEGFHRGVLPLRAPRLRWSQPKFTPRRGLIRGTRMVRQGVKAQPRDGVKRLGKIRGAVLDLLDAAGGCATVAEISATLHRSRPRDLRRRVLPMLEEARIIAVEGDTVTLASDWLERLEEARELGGEIHAEHLEHQRHKREGEAFRQRLRVVPDPAPSWDEMRERRERRPHERRQAIEVAIAHLFAERPEYRSRRVGQIVCQLPRYLPGDFPYGQDGFPKDAEVEEILAGEGAA